MKLPEPVPLRVQREELSRRLAERLAEQAPLAELQDLRARLALLDEAIAVATPRRPAWRHPLIALGVVAALVSAAALWPMPRVSFALELDADAAQLQMSRAGTLEGDVVDGELRAEGFGRLESADAALVQRAADNGAGQLGLQAQRLRLRRIHYPAGAHLDFEAGPRSVRIAIDGAPHAVEIEFGGDAAMSLGGAPREQRRIDNAEWLRLVSDKAPTELWLAHASERSFQWRGLQPQSLRFVERQAGADGPAQLVSSLQRGQLRLPATGRELTLVAGSGLVLDGLQLEQAELALGTHAALKLSGSAQTIELDTAGFRRSLSPSLLEYAAHNHTLGLLWSAAGLLWGISTWLRKAVGDKD
jgi:hypothetical protein